MSTDLTSAQREIAFDMFWLLAAAEHCDLWREADGSNVLTDRDHFGVTDPLGTFTDEVRLLEEADLVEAHPLPYAKGVEAGWRLTDAGKVAHAELLARQ